MGVDIYEYLVESDMSLSPDGEYIYYVGVDTALPNWTGIYRAEISNPSRELIVRIDSVSSPAADGAGKHIYAIRRNKIINVGIADSSISELDVLSGRELHKIVTLNDSLIIAWADASIFRINLLSLQVDSIGPGAYPSLLPCDSFIYLLPDPLSNNVLLEMPFNLQKADTLYMFGNHTMMQWPTCDCADENVAYTFPAENRLYYIYLKNIGVPGALRTLLDSTYSSQILKISSLQILYTGFNGKIYRVSENGHSEQFTYRREETGEPIGK